MKVFISWSGSVSHSIALAFRDWLPCVINAIEPYVSSEDIDKGARWNTDISQELEESGYGILCVTAENIDAPWVNFEAGALSKSLERSRVAPFLFGIQRADVTGPLLQFQSTVYERGDVFKLLRSINGACEISDNGAIQDARLGDIFDVWWPKLEQQLDGVNRTPPEDNVAARSDQEVLAEVLELVRAQQKMLSDPRTILPPDYLEYLTHRPNRNGAPRAVAYEASIAWRNVEIYLRKHGSELETLSPVLHESLMRLRDPMNLLMRYTLRAPGRKPLTVKAPISESAQEDEEP